MKNLKYEAWISGVALSSVAPEIFVSGIEYEAPRRQISAEPLANRFGQIMTQSRFDPATVRISFVTKRISGVRRQKIVEAVAKWASGAQLMISDRPDQQLRVNCMQFPYIPDSCSFTDPITIEFQTIENPFWEDLIPTTYTMSGTEGYGTFYVPGNAPQTYGEVKITPVGNLSTVMVALGSTSITLEDVGASAGTPITIGYTPSGILRIRRGNTSILDKRTAASADDLIAYPGAINAARFEADGTVSVEFAVKGAWL